MKLRLKLLNQKNVNRLTIELPLEFKRKSREEDVVEYPNEYKKV